MLIRHVIGGLAVLALTGCASVPMGRAPPPPAPAPAPAPEGTGVFEVARGFAGPHTYLAPVPTALVLIDGTAPYARRLQLCESFIRVPRASDVRASSDVDVNLIVTRMPLSVSDLEGAWREDCGYLLSHYDHARAQRIMAQLGLEGRVGPVLVAIFPDAIAHGDTPFLVVDASDVPAAQIPAAIAEWQAATLRASARLQRDGDLGVWPQPAPIRLSEAPGNVCDWAGKAVEIAGPVLAELLEGTFTSHPLVRVAFRLIGGTAAGRAGETLQLEGDDVFKVIGTGTRTLCGRLVAARTG